MSLLAKIGGFGQVLGIPGSGLLSSFGGGSQVNIARNLSAKVGCTILQADSNQAKALLAKGINPCTNQPMTGGPATIEDQLAAIDRAQEAFQRTQVKVPTGFGPAQPMISQERIEQMIPIGRTAMSIQQNLVGGAIATAGRTIGGIILPTGRRISKKDAIAFLKRVGDVVTGAALLGITQQQAADLVIQGSKRRARGITAAQVRNARRTTGMVARLARDLGCCKPPVRRRKTPCR